MAAEPEYDPLSDETLGVTWSGNGTALCYDAKNLTTQTVLKSFCGHKDKCSGLVLPLFFELTWAREARAVLYFVALIYSFLGVSIVADIFMCAIEKITSKTKQIYIASSKDDAPEVIEIPVWNGTVANLTLMALAALSFLAVTLLGLVLLGLSLALFRRSISVDK